eukprot:gene16180-biopygen5246
MEERWERWGICARPCGGEGHDVALVVFRRGFDALWRTTVLAACGHLCRWRRGRPRRLQPCPLQSWSQWGLREAAPDQYEAFFFPPVGKNVSAGLDN